MIFAKVVTFDHHSALSHSSFQNSEGVSELRLNVHQCTSHREVGLGLKSHLKDLNLFKTKFPTYLYVHTWERLTFDLIILELFQPYFHVFQVICALISLKSVVLPSYLEQYVKYLQGTCEKPDPER